MELFSGTEPGPDKEVINSKQINFVMHQIGKVSSDKLPVPQKFSGPMYVIFFHSGSVLFQQVQIYPEEKVVKFVARHETSQEVFQKPKYVPLSSELLSYVQKELKGPK